MIHYNHWNRLINFCFSLAVFIYFWWTQLFIWLRFWCQWVIGNSHRCNTRSLDFSYILHKINPLFSMSLDRQSSCKPLVSAYSRQTTSGISASRTKWKAPWLSWWVLSFFCNMCWSFSGCRQLALAPLSSFYPSYI